MHRLLEPLLACPACGGELRLAAGAEELICVDSRAGAGHVWPVVRGIPRFVGNLRTAGAETRTVRAFERQWQSYGRLRRIFGKDPRAMRANLVGARMGQRIDADWYRGKTVLDAGCGHGRYLRAFADMGAQVVGLDIGRGPEEAGVPLDDPALAVVQGSVLEAPFRDQSFDLVFSDGVIHHTPDAHAAYLELARLVKPGGALYIWVYPQEGRLRELVFGTARKLTTRLPGSAVRLLSFAVAPLTLFVRSYSGTRLGQATWGECAQVVHDWIAPPLQSHHTWDEVAGWAAEAGLVDPEELPIPTGITAWKPDPERGTHASAGR